MSSSTIVAVGRQVAGADLRFAASLQRRRRSRGPASPSRRGRRPRRPRAGAGAATGPARGAGAETPAPRRSRRRCRRRSSPRPGRRRAAEVGRGQGVARAVAPVIDRAVAQPRVRVRSRRVDEAAVMQVSVEPTAGVPSSRRVDRHRDSAGSSAATTLTSSVGVTCCPPYRSPRRSGSPSADGRGRRRVAELERVDLGACRRARRWRTGRPCPCRRGRRTRSRSARPGRPGSPSKRPGRVLEADDRRRRRVRRGRQQVAQRALDELAARRRRPARGRTPNVTASRVEMIAPPRGGVGHRGGVVGLDRLRAQRLVVGAPVAQAQRDAAAERRAVGGLVRVVGGVSLSVTGAMPSNRPPALGATGYAGDLRVGGVRPWSCRRRRPTGGR